MLFNSYYFWSLLFLLFSVVLVLYANSDSPDSLKVYLVTGGIPWCRIWESKTTGTMETTTAAPLMETIETGISYYLAGDARHWIPNGFVTVDLVVDAAALAEDFYGTLDEAAESWADANLGAGAFFQIIMEP